MTKTETKNAFRVYLTNMWSKCGKKTVLFVVSVLFVAITGVFSYTRGGAQAAPSATLNFQGRLLGSSGSLVADGTYNIEFNLYTASAGGSTQWTEDYLNTGTPVTVRNGFFSVYLGSLTAFPGTINWDQEQYLGMTVRGTGSCAFGACTPADSEMTPRFKLTAIPRALSAANVNSGATSTASTDSNGVTVQSGNATGVTSNSGSVTIDAGTATGTAGTISLGASNASALSLGRSGLATAIQGSLTVAEATALNGDVGLGNASTDLVTISGTIQGANALVFEGATADAFETTLAVQDPTADVTIRLPALAAGTYDVCTSSGNCLGTGDIIQGGNTYGAAVRIGTNDAYDLEFETSNTLRVSINATTGTVTLSNDLAVNGNTTIGNATSDRLTVTSQILGANPLVFQGATDNANTTTFAITDPTGTNTITFPDASGTVQLSPTSGSFIKQVPASSGENTITPTANSVVGLTVNATSGTAATALSVVQGGAAAGITINSSNNTATNGLSFSGTYTNLISSSNFTVTNAGAVTAVGVNSGTGLLQGALGLTVTGATASINASSNFDTNLNTGTSTGAVNIGNALAGAISVQSATTVGLTGTTSITGLTTGDALTVSNSTSTGNILVLKDNATAVLTVADGGTTTLGASAGTAGLINNGFTQFTTLAVADDSNGGALGGTPGSPLTAAQSVDIYSSISIAQTTASQTITLPTPTAGTAYGRILYISNIGSTSFTLLGTTVNAGTTATLIWSNTNGGASWQFAGADGNGILNQNSTTQTANFKINGSGQADGGFIAPSLERASAGTLSVGTTSNTTAITLGSTNLTGSLNVDSGASSTIAIGSSASARTINIGNVAAVQAITIGSTNSTSSLTLQAGTGALNIQSQGTGGINIGTNGVAQVVAIGNTTGASGITERVGAGNYSLDGLTNSTYDIGTSTTTGTISIGGTAQTGGLTLGRSTDTNTISIGTGVTASGKTQTINIGNNGAAGSTTTTTIGSTIAGNITLQSASTINVNAPTIATNATTLGLFNTNATTITALQVGTSISIGATTGTLTVRNANQTFGNAAGSGLFQNNGATRNTALVVGDDSNGGALGGTPGTPLTAAQSVDVYTYITINQTTAGQAVTLPSPTDTTAGRVLYISSIGSAAFSIGTATYNTGTSATLVWDGTAWRAAGIDTGVTTVGALNGGTANANGATISGTTIYLQKADATYAGLIDTAAQNFAGVKTFNAGLISGTSAGTGTFTNNGSTVNTTLVVNDDSDGGALGGTPSSPLTAAASVDVYTSISVNQTTASKTITIPTPTASTTYGRILYISNVGSTAFTLLGSVLNPGATATLVWSNTNGGATWQYAGADGNAIINQNSLDQSANFRITGTGQANTSFTTPLIDSITGALSIGTATATGVTIGGASTTGTISLGNGGVANTIQVGNTTGAVAQTINLGNNATASSSTTLNIGSAIGTSPVLIQGGSSGVIIRPAASAAAFVVQNASSNPLINVDSTNGRTTIGYSGSTANVATGQLYVPGSLPTGSLGSVGSSITTAQRLEVQGRYVYIIGNQSGTKMTVVDVSNPASPLLLGGSVTNANGNSSNQIAISGSGVYFDSGDQMQPVDINNPNLPVLGATAGVSNGSGTGIAVQGHVTFTTSGSDMQAFDISSGAAVSIANSTSLLTGTGVVIQTQGSYAYVGGSTNLNVIDISNPASLSKTGTVAYGSAITDLKVQGRYVYAVSSAGNNLKSYDVKNPLVAPVATNTLALVTNCSPNAIDVQERYAYIACSGVANVIQVVDISDPANLVSVGTIAGGAAIKDVAVQGRYLYAIDASQNLKTFDIGGTYTQSLEAGSIESNLITTKDLSVSNNVSVRGGLTAGSVRVANDLSVSGTLLFKNTANSTIALRVQNAAGNNYLLIDTSGAIANFGNTGIASTLQIGNTTGAVAQTINVGNNGTASSTTTLTVGSLIGTSTTAIKGGTGSSGISLLTGAGGGISIATGTNSAATGAISITSGNSSSNVAGNVSLDTGTSSSGAPTIDIGNSTNSIAKIITVGGTTQTGTITVGQSTAAQTINIASANSTSGAQAINIGNGTTGAATTVSILSGVGTAGASILNLGNNTRVTAIDIGNIAAAAARTINIGTGNNTAAADTINLGTGTPSSSGTKVVTIGSSAAVANTTTINGGNGAGAIALQASSGGTITIGASAAATVNIGTGAFAHTIAIGTDNTTTQGITIGSTSASSVTAINGGTGTGVSIQVGSTGAISIGSAAASTVNIGTGAFAHTVSIATDATTNQTVSIGSTSGSSSLTLSSSGAISLAATGETYTSGARTLNIATSGASTVGGALTVAAGAGGTGTGYVGGALNLQGGAAGGTNANGGNVVITGGAGAGTGVRGLVVLDTATYSASTVQNFTTSANITQSNIDAYGSLLISSNAAGYTATLSDPTNTTAGRLVYVSNSGLYDMTLAVNGGVGSTNIVTLKPNTTATMIWNGSDWTAAGASSSTDLQAAYNNTATSAGGAEIVLSSTGTGGLTVRNDGTTPIIGGLLEVQTSIGSNLFTVNNNATEYANNGGAESSTFTMWAAAPAGGSVSRYTTAGNNIATGAASIFSDNTSTANTGIKNTLASSLTVNLKYKVSYTVRHVSSTVAFTTLDTIYSSDGTSTTQTCASSSTSTYSSWTRIDCSFTATAVGASNAIIIRHSDAVEHDFYIDNLSVTVSADVSHAADGSVDSALGTNWTQYDADGGAGTTTIARDTTTIYDTSGSVSDITTAHINEGMRNNMSITPSISTQYLVSFYAKSSNTFNDITVGFLPAGGSSTPVTAQLCADYNTQSVSTSSWTKITCIVTTPSSGISDPDLVIYQPTATARTFYVDALTITLNTNNSSNVQIGGGNKGGPTTLFTLDRSNGAPIGANNDAYLGSMYYDTSSGRIQCYESDGWGACGAAPDNIVNLNPEYAGAVLNGTGIGTMTADFCSNDTALTVNSTLCSTGQAKNYYKWTSPQATSQTYSIYVTYQLPATFNGFSSDDTVQLYGRVDNTTNASVTYEMYKSTGSVVTQCGSGETNVITGGGGSANTWYSYGVNGNESTGCSFSSSSAGNFVIFKVNMKANSNANAYISTLSFTTTGR